MTTWKSYRACSECGAAAKQVCRDADNERREAPCGGRETWATIDLSRLSRTTLERHSAALERECARLKGDLTEARAEKERLRKLSHHLQATIDQIRSATGSR